MKEKMLMALTGAIALSVGLGDAASAAAFVSLTDLGNQSALLELDDGSHWLLGTQSVNDIAENDVVGSSTPWFEDFDLAVELAAAFQATYTNTWANELSGLTGSWNIFDVKDSVLAANVGASFGAATVNQGDQVIGGFNVLLSVTAGDLIPSADVWIVSAEQVKVPEPASMLGLLAIGAVAAGGVSSRRKRLCRADLALSNHRLAPLVSAARGFFILA